MSTAEPPVPTVVVRGATQVLAHAPGLARLGSKPSRELPKNPDVEKAFLTSLRTFEEAVAYPPHQAYIGSVHPRDLPARPWTAVTTGGDRTGPSGEVIPEVELLGLLAAVDEFDLITLAPDVAERAAAALNTHALAKTLGVDRIERAVGDVETVAKQPGVLTLHTRDGRLAGAIRAGQLDDESL
ncbi:MAG: glycine reductase, partial [Acidimicrobiales bacterium]